MRGRLLLSLPLGRCPEGKVSNHVQFFSPSHLLLGYFCLSCAQISLNYVRECKHCSLDRKISWQSGAKEDHTSHHKGSSLQPCSWERFLTALLQQGRVSSGKLLQLCSGLLSLLCSALLTPALLWRSDTVLLSSTVLQLSSTRGKFS